MLDKLFPGSSVHVILFPPLEDEIEILSISVRFALSLCLRFIFSILLPSVHYQIINNETLIISKECFNILISRINTATRILLVSHY